LTNLQNVFKSIICRFGFPNTLDSIVSLGV
jgi:hypothetical protein